ncbi:HEAT repeat domain-containing protein [Adhaeretor mobilis]|uniref:HEAT repeat domain-containing protein n=1 Tax=Adhaeretor mobilis TaxID=1930276 RepID=A0A517N2D0_9BACT|nr:HEAT repeat domain-containing protein [Adhaeretor mobilis]QDT01299.1 hypothetical protein HG15A2_46410 [Adhaeretor mobilis]
MSSSLPSPSSSDEPPAGSVAADDLLPPVEPPSAKFIIQLFVTPMIIVACVVGVWLLIQWLANSGGEDPDKIVAALRSSNQARFQQAERLSHMLQAEGRYPELKTNSKLLGKLADLLIEQVDAPGEGEGDITMRIFLAKSLGEFHVDDGLPALIATAQRDKERDVRRFAVNGIAVLASTVPDLDRPELRELLRSLADSDDQLLRSEAAFAAGVLAAAPEANAEYRELLAALAEDFYPDARYNAALGLARAGDLRAVPVLQEMLDLESLSASVESEEGVGDQADQDKSDLLVRLRKSKRDTLLKTTLRGVELLLEKHSPGDLSGLNDSLDQFLTQAGQLEEPQLVPNSLLEKAEQLKSKFESSAP